MRLVTRSVLRELWPPFLLGFASYTFLLLLRTIFQMTELVVRGNATVAEIGYLLLLSLPWIVVLTLPMAFLLAVLVGVGRLAADSELVALRSCGVSPAALYRPVLAAGAVLAVLVFGIYDRVLPAANDVLTRKMARLAATSVFSIVSPRTFREPRPGMTLFFDRAGTDPQTLEGVFLRLEDPSSGATDRVIVARRGTLTLEGESLWLDLTESTVHEYSPDDPSRYRVSQNRTQRILFAGDVARESRSRVTYEKGLRAQSVSELRRSAERARTQSPERYRLAWAEIHKKLAIPFASIAFGFIGIPLAETARRGGRGSSFALSLALIVLYYVLISSGETWAETGVLPPGLAIWLADGLLILLGAFLLRGLGRERARWRRPAITRLRLPGAPPLPPRPAWLSGFLRFPALLDRYVLARFASAFLLVLGSVLLVSAVVDYADQSDEILRNHPPASAVVGYYRYFLLSIGMQVAPFVALVATLLSLGSLSKNNEDTACKASGVSLHRLAAPILVVATLGAGAAFWIGDRVLPFANQLEARYRNVIHGRTQDAGLRTPAERDWRYAPDGRIWHSEESFGERGTLLAPTVFELDPKFDLVRRTAARLASWNGNAWIFRQGWARSFEGARETSYSSFLEQPVAGETPRSFHAERRPSDQMRYRELARYAGRLRRSGYPTESLETALQQKVSRPALIPLMALLALPFSFRLGRRGTLAGIGVGLVLGMIFLVLAEFFTRLGTAGALPPTLAAWSPNVLFATAGVFLLVKLRT